MERHSLDLQSANPTNWSNTLKQFVSMPVNRLSVFDHFWRLVPKGLRSAIVKRIKLLNTVGKLITTLAGIKRKMLIGKAG